ncbi:hypothetical protein E2C01_062287 [Portunus trituberculatus]|uniref:Uncharacterized protein n=1 Tax=Portunus trituberculatus TaxID=210409 RepID=A0A5B7HEQ6_PORTR|nr:hypothetical protein [Portunus trituberculatus]
MSFLRPSPLFPFPLTIFRFRNPLTCCPHLPSHVPPADPSSPPQSFTAIDQQNSEAMWLLEGHEAASTTSDTRVSIIERRQEGGKEVHEVRGVEEWGRKGLVRSERSVVVKLFVRSRSVSACLLPWAAVTATGGVGCRTRRRGCNKDHFPVFPRLWKTPNATSLPASLHALTVALPFLPSFLLSKPSQSHPRISPPVFPFCARPESVVNTG